MRAVEDFTFLKPRAIDGIVVWKIFKEVTHGANEIGHQPSAATEAHLQCLLNENCRLIF